MRIVILEDDRDQAELLTAWLEQAGHQCAVYSDGTSFIRAYTKDSYDLVLLDWMVPSTSGIDVLKHLRSQIDNVVPVVFITMARVNAIARRMGFGDNNTLDIYDQKPYFIDTRLREVKLDGKVVEMTQKEYELTLFLFKNLGRVVSRGHLLEMVWGTSSQINTRTVDTHISRLRTKLELDNQEFWQLTSVYRHGYRLEKRN